MDFYVRRRSLYELEIYSLEAYSSCIIENPKPEAGIQSRNANIKKGPPAAGRPGPARPPRGAKKGLQKP